MNALTFDTLAYVKTLREAGVEEKQAEAQAAALAAILKDSSSDLATKADIALMEERTKGQFTLLQWMAGFNLAFCVAILWLLIRTMI